MIPRGAALLLAVCAMAVPLLVADMGAASPPSRTGCPLDLDDPRAVVVDATVLATHQATYRCGDGSQLAAVNRDQAMTLLDVPSPGTTTNTVERPTESTGCVLVVDSPSCARTQRLVSTSGGAQIESDEPPDIEVEIDGVKRRTRFTAGMWRACGLAAGRHELRLCTDAGPLTCTVPVEAAAIASLNVVLVAPTVEIRVDHVHRGALRVGETSMIGLAGYTGPDHVQLPPHATFAWRADDPQHRASLCTAPPSKPGCTRCDGGSGSPPWLAVVLVALLVLRRRR